jgi:hypothetical protein
MRAVLLAIATVAMLGGRRLSRPPTQLEPSIAHILRQRKAVRAP